jgi:hypothetical protein
LACKAIEIGESASPWVYKGVYMRKELPDGYIDFNSYTPIGNYGEAFPEKYSVEIKMCFTSKEKAQLFFNYISDKIDDFIDDNKLS